VATVRLYIDEDITDDLARVLRARGFDALSVYDLDMTGKTDSEQAAFAVEQQRTLLSFNVKHFSAIATQYAAESRTHFGIVVSNQLLFGELLRRVLILLRLQTAEKMVNRFDWLQNYKV
jgi:hypothetical protein